jgi:glutathione S-transferase
VVDQEHWSSLKPIILHSHASGPNPWKVAIILEELGVPYENKFYSPSDLKKEPYVSLNPNGRAPTIEDPNTEVKLWESGAIIQYLAETYDKDENISYSKGPEKYRLWQWLAFQISGQGPYFGQAAWFAVIHHEKLPSAIERYLNEIERVTSVLDSWLQKHEWLVGDKVTYADLAFIPWANAVPFLNGDGKISISRYKAYEAWLAKLNSRPTVQKVLKDQEAAKAAAGH